MFCCKVNDVPMLISLVSGDIGLCKYVYGLFREDRQVCKLGLLPATHRYSV